MHAYYLCLTLLMLAVIDKSDEQVLRISSHNMAAVRKHISKFVTLDCLSQLIAGGTDCNHTVSDKWFKSRVADDVRSYLNKGDMLNSQINIQKLACCTTYNGMECVLGVAKKHCNYEEYKFMEKYKSDSIKMAEQTTCSNHKYGKCPSGAAFKSPSDILVISSFIIFYLSQIFKSN